MTEAAQNRLVWVDRFARAVGRHWLLLLNSAVVLYAALPWIGPLLQNAGFNRAGHFIFLLYDRVCHQLPERSFFVNGSQVCYCHRCTALYSTIACIGLLYGLLRWRSALSSRLLLLASVPMAVDVAWHVMDDVLPGLHLRSTANGVGSLNFTLRMVTGALFGAAAALWIYPRLRQGMAPVDAYVHVQPGGPHSQGLSNG